MGDLSEAEKELLWDSLDRAFLDTSTFGRASEQAVEQAVERIVAARMADAWDEGYYRGVRDNEFEMEPADNPYRDEAAR